MQTMIVRNYPVNKQQRDILENINRIRKSLHIKPLKRLILKDGKIDSNRMLEITKIQLHKPMVSSMVMKTFSYKSLQKIFEIAPNSKITLSNKKYWYVDSPTDEIKELVETV